MCDHIIVHKKNVFTVNIKNIGPHEYTYNVLCLIKIFLLVLIILPMYDEELKLDDSFKIETV